MLIKQKAFLVKEKTMSNNKPFVWGNMPDGREVICYPLIRGGLKAEVLNLGGIVYSLQVPDKKGNHVDVMLGFDTPQEYLNSDTYFGAIIGRYSNRIEEGRFELDGQTYPLEINNGRNNLHSGKNGFHQYLFEAEYDESKPYRLVLHGKNDGVEKENAESMAETQGFPGTLQLKVIYELTEDNAFNITYEATTDKATPVNMTWHGYFNLNGHDSENILGHEMKINAGHYTPFKDENMIPSGEAAEVTNTPFDFREVKSIGRDIEDDHPQLIIGGGYDHNFVFDKEDGWCPVATVNGEQSGIAMTVYTDRPCMQLYTGNFIVTQKGKMGATYQHRQGFCMETQTYPNAVNCKAFPADVLMSGQVYKTSTSYRFIAE